MTSLLQSLCKKVWRRKTYTEEELEHSELKRCLSIWELTLYGVGQTIGSGIYVLSGTVIRSNAGPASPLSYLIGGLVSLMSALCYAEFSTIVPRAGSSYTYTYFTIGEWVAFVIGWDLMLEHAMVAASTSRALISSVDLLLDHSIQNFTAEHIGEMHVPGLSQYPSFLGGFIVIFVSVIVMMGAKQSVLTTAVLASLNIIISIIIVCTGLSYANFDNWRNIDHGGYAPNGVGGVLSASAIVIAAYSGYDAVCTASEETKNPKRTLPIAIISTMCITMVVYISLISTITLAVPYYTVDPNAAFTKLFQDVKVYWAADFVTAAICCAAFSVSLCNMFAVSRIAFAMARDGVLFKCLGYVMKSTQTPVMAVIVFALVTACLSILFEVGQLAEIISMGSLMAATIVPLSVIILRYRPNPTGGNPKPDENPNAGNLNIRFHGIPLLRSMNKKANLLPIIVPCMIVLMVITSAMVRLLTHYRIDSAGGYVCMVIAIVTTICVAALTCLLACLDQNNLQCSFRIPMVPFFPALASYLNILCLGQISDMGWIRYLVWMLVGSVIYFAYGIRHATVTEESENVPLTSDNGSRKSSYDSGKVS